MKKWFLERFLPLWAKQTVLQDNRLLMAENRQLYQRIREKDAYIKGLEAGLSAAKRLSRHKEGGKA